MKSFKTALNAGVVICGKDGQVVTLLHWEVTTRKLRFLVGTGISGSYNSQQEYCIALPHMDIVMVHRMMPASSVCAFLKITTCTGIFSAVYN